MLSRLLNTNVAINDDKETNFFVPAIAQAAILRAVSMKEIAASTEADEDLTRLRESLRTDVWSKEQKKYEVIKNELGVLDVVVSRGTKIVLSKNLHERALEIAHKGHPVVVGMKQGLLMRPNT